MIPSRRIQGLLALASLLACPFFCRVAELRAADEPAAAPLCSGCASDSQEQPDSPVEPDPCHGACFCAADFVAAQPTRLDAPPSNVAVLDLTACAQPAVVPHSVLALHYATNSSHGPPIPLPLRI